MYILNTTYSIHSSAVDDCIDYIRTQHIPYAESCGLQSPQLMKVQHKSDDGYINYALQFSTDNIATIESWLSDEYPMHKAKLYRLFRQNVLTFNTIMETI